MKNGIKLTRVSLAVTSRCLDFALSSQLQKVNPCCARATSLSKTIPI
jgi:hypothetical protein